MRFTFDPNKDAANITKHGLSLADAPVVFAAPDKLTLASPQGDEARLLDVAMVAVAGVVLALVYVLREQLPGWFAAVRQIQNPVAAAYLQTLLLLGARPGEVLALRWEDLNTQWRGLTIRDKVEGERVVPLTPYVAQLLAGLPRRNEWVFASGRVIGQDAVSIKRRARYHASKGTTGPVASASTTGHITEPNGLHSMACTVAGVKGLTLHGLRRSFKSLTEWLEIPAGVVAQLMGHKPSATAEKHYTVRPLDLLRVHHERIEAWILEQAGVTFDAAAPAGLRVVSAT